LTAKRRGGWGAGGGERLGRPHRHARIGDEDVEPVADDGADPTRERGRRARIGEVGGEHFGAAALVADRLDDRLGLGLAAAIVDEHLRAARGERQSRGSADAARSAGDERGLSGKRGHD
jgi:hypothetical protein